MIVYRDTLGGGQRTPPHLVGAASLVRRATSRGDLLAIGNPLVVQQPPDGSVWHKLPEMWDVCLVGDLTPGDIAALGRRDPSAIRTTLVRDARGRPWIAPVIFNASGGMALPVPWGRDATTGQWRRSPTAAQAAWIAAATAARSEILASDGVDAGAAVGIATVPIEVSAEWAATLLCAVYHLSREVIQALALLDDALVLQVLLAAAGLPLPAAEVG